MFRIFIVLFIVFFSTTSQQVWGEGASLGLVPSEGKHAEGTTFTVDVHLDTKGIETYGTDLALSYDTRRLMLLDIREGSLFPTYTGETINSEDGTGEVSGIVEPGTSFSGSGVFATLEFKALKEGKADVAISFSSGERNDSNIAGEGGDDVLSEVQNGEYQIVGHGYEKSLWQMIAEFFKNLIT